MKKIASDLHKVTYYSTLIAQRLEGIQIYINRELLFCPTMKSYVVAKGDRILFINLFIAKGKS